MLYLYSSTRAAVDLASIMVGIIIIGIIGGIIAATIFAVIPWSQDNAARAAIGAARTAEGTYRSFTAEDNGAPGLYGTYDELHSYNKNGRTGLIQDTDKLTIVTAKLSNGDPCYAVASKSDSGNIFYGSSLNADVSTDPASTAECAVIEPTDGSNPTTPGASLPVEEGQAALPYHVAGSYDSANGFQYSGYGDYKSSVVGSWGAYSNQYGTITEWYPADGNEVTLKYYDPDTKKYVQFYNEEENYSGPHKIDGDVQYNSATKQVYGYFVDSAPDMSLLDVDGGFSKMATNGGSMSFKATGGSTVSVVWYPMTEGTPEGYNPSWPQPGDNTGGGTGGGGPSTGPIDGGDNPPASQCGSNDDGAEYNTYDDNTQYWFARILNQNDCRYVLNMSAGNGYPGYFVQGGVDQIGKFGTPTDTGYTVFQESKERPGLYHEATASAYWVAANGSTITVDYLDGGVYKNLITTQQNTEAFNGSRELSTYDPSHDGEKDTIAYQGGTYDSSKPEAGVYLNMYTNTMTWGSKSPSYAQYSQADSCVDDFYNDRYLQKYTNPKGYSGTCLGTDESLSFFDNTDRSGADFPAFEAKMDLMAQNGGRITFTTTQGKTVTVPIAAGRWRVGEDAPIAS